MKNAIEVLKTTERIILSFPFLFLSAAIVVNVVMRKVFAANIFWLEEFSRYIFVFSTFLGASIAVTMNKHPKMSALQDVIGKKRAAWLILFSDIICTGISAYLCVYAVTQVMNLVRLQTITSAMSMPLWIVYVIIPISMIGMVIRFFLLIMRDINTVLGKGEKS